MKYIVILLLVFASLNSVSQDSSSVQNSPGTEMIKAVDLINGGLFLNVLGGGVLTIALITGLSALLPVGIVLGAIGIITSIAGLQKFKKAGKLFNKLKIGTS